MSVEQCFQLLNISTSLWVHYLIFLLLKLACLRLLAYAYVKKDQKTGNFQVSSQLLGVNQLMGVTPNP